MKLPRPVEHVRERGELEALGGVRLLECGEIGDVGVRHVESQDRLAALLPESSRLEKRTAAGLVGVGLETLGARCERCVAARS